jgi:hypothetical protein
MGKAERLKFDQSTLNKRVVVLGANFLPPPPGLAERGQVNPAINRWAIFDRPGGTILDRSDGLFWIVPVGLEHAVIMGKAERLKF